jgi:hypothetical protein
MNDWRVLDPEDLVLAVAGHLLTAAVERPGQKVWLQQELERRGILATNIDVNKAVEKLRRRYRWCVDAAAGEPGYRLEQWPWHFTRQRRAARGKDGSEDDGR